MKARTSKTILSLQALRALAAMMVVAYHSTQSWVGLTGAGTTWSAGAHGVDVFFVLSGFIMPLSIRHIGSRQHTAAQFFRRRLERILPMYWLFSIFKILLHVTGRSHEAWGTWTYVLRAFLLLPSINESGDRVPLLLVGWTLQFELLFYVLITISLLFGWRLMYAVPALLCILSCAYFLPWLDSTSIDRLRYPYLLEFLLGMLIFRWVTVEGARLAVWLCGVLFCSAALLLVLPTASTILFHLQGAFCASVLVGTAILLEESWGRWLPRFLLLLGDASYSIYLIHVPLLKYVPSVVSHLKSGYSQQWVYVSTALTIACASGTLCYLLVERKINEYFHVRRASAIKSAS